MIDGVKIQLGEKEYIVPPLNFKSIKALQADIAAMGSITPGAIIANEDIDRVVRVVRAALERNYPEITTEALEEVIDMTNIKEVLQAIMGASGFRQGEKQPGKKAANP